MKPLFAIALLASMMLNSSLATAAEPTSQADHQLDRHEAHARPFGRVYDGQQGVGGGDRGVLKQDAGQAFF